MNNSNVREEDSRPYRSHKIPACTNCRARKIACRLSSPSAPCRFCSRRNLSCVVSNSKHRSDGQSSSSRTRRRSSTKRNAGVGQHGSLAQLSGDACAPTFTSPEESATMLMNPPMAEDLNVLDQYLTSGAAGSVTFSEPYVRVSSTSKDDSIVYLSVPRQRKGLQATVDPGRAQLEILEQILGQHKEDVLRLYFEKIHPCLPIIDQASFWQMWQHDRARISSTLLCEMYAVSFVFWQCSESLRGFGQPDMVFAWNTAVTALRDDLLAPCMTTVHASVLAITGRPTIGMTGNVVKAGSMITLAHSLALHRDPSSWQIPQAEKRVRINVWWAVVIHDYWSSIAHGTPPNIRRENYDVPLPSPDSRSDGMSLSFGYLCSISEILGEVLPLIYALRTDAKQTEKKAATRNASALPEEKQYRLAKLRESAVDLSEFVRSLYDENLREFWLPYTAYLLVSAATSLLRAALESPLEAKTQCVRSLLGLSARLTAARETCAFDIADFCLQRCKPTIDKLAASLGLSGEEPTANDRSLSDEAMQHQSSELPSQGSAPVRHNSDFLLPLDTLDFQFDLFADLGTPWPVNT